MAFFYLHKSNTEYPIIVENSIQVIDALNKLLFIEILRYLFLWSISDKVDGLKLMLFESLTDIDILHLQDLISLPGLLKVLTWPTHRTV